MPSTSLNSLHRADGSATYTHDGYSVVAAVNGPMEVQRRDELPEEAAIDVAIRPASGVGGSSRDLHEKRLADSIGQVSARGILNP